MSNDHTNYPSYINKRAEWIKSRQNDPNRFVPFHERENRTVLSEKLVQVIEPGKYTTAWRGVGICKDPFDLIIYQSMLWDIRPRTVIEIGALEGGNSLWIADIMNLFNLQCHVYSMDIDLSMVNNAARGRDDITFLEGDCCLIEKTFTQDLLKKLPHPWMIIEDAHVNLQNVLEHFFTYMTSGDYLIVEDGNPNLIMDMEDAFVSGKGQKWGDGKLKQIGEFMSKHPVELMIDTFYQDRFGYNCSWNMNGFLRKM